MKVEFLKELGLEQEVIDKIMAEKGKAFAEIERENADLKEAKETLETQLVEANTTIESFKEMDVETIKREVDDWKEKAEQAETAAAERIAEIEYERAIEKAMAGLKFSSNSAKKQFERDVKEKGLTLENGALLGFDDYVKTYKDQDEKAFASEEEEGKPKFSSGSAPTPKEPDDDARIDAIMGIKRD
ncbi:MAG: phage scaffolding protein [Christensenellaceae bacterium]|jgi:hypothetical protein